MKYIVILGLLLLGMYADASDLTAHKDVTVGPATESNQALLVPGFSADDAIKFGHELFKYIADRSEDDSICVQPTSTIFKKLDVLVGSINLKVSQLSLYKGRAVGGKFLSKSYTDVDVEEFNHVWGLILTRFDSLVLERKAYGLSAFFYHADEMNYGELILLLGVLSSDLNQGFNYKYAICLSFNPRKSCLSQLSDGDYHKLCRF